MRNARLRKSSTKKKADEKSGRQETRLIRQGLDRSLTALERRLRALKGRRLQGVCRAPTSDTCSP